MNSASLNLIAEWKPWGRKRAKKEGRKKGKGEGRERNCYPRGFLLLQPFQAQGRADDQHSTCCRAHFQFDKVKVKLVSFLSEQKGLVRDTH